MPGRSAIERTLTQMPNVGPAMAGDLILLGITDPAQLKGKDPLKLYHRLETLTKVRQDPCVLDTFMALVDFAATGKSTPWFAFTKERKKKYGDKVHSAAFQR